MRITTKTEKELRKTGFVCLGRRPFHAPARTVTGVDQLVRYGVPVYLRIDKERRFGTVWVARWARDLIVEIDGYIATRADPLSGLVGLVDADQVTATATGQAVARLINDPDAPNRVHVFLSTMILCGLDEALDSLNFNSTSGQGGEA